jgi:hypothetical protein
LSQGLIAEAACYFSAKTLLFGYNKRTKHLGALVCQAILIMFAKAGLYLGYRYGIDLPLGRSIVATDLAKQKGHALQTSLFARFSQAPYLKDKGTYTPAMLYKTKYFRYIIKS